MYSVEWEQHALDQIVVLPAEAFRYIAELVTFLEVQLWSGPLL